jgi:membrane associated rhomboid family serine protease
MLYLTAFRQTVFRSPLTSTSISSQFQSSSSRSLNIVPSRIFRCNRSSVNTKKTHALPPKPKNAHPSKQRNAPKQGTWKPPSSTITIVVEPTIIKSLSETSPLRYSPAESIRKSIKQNVPNHKARKELGAAADMLSRDHTNETKQSIYEKMPPEHRPHMRYLPQTMWTIAVVVGIYCSLAMFDAWNQPIPAPLPQKNKIAPTNAASPYPQTYLITPSQVLEVSKIGLHDLDRVSVGIAAAMGALTFLDMKSFVKASLIFSASAPPYTIVTYALVHKGWTHWAPAIYSVIWILPVIRKEFDDNLYHTSAFIACAAALTGWAQHISLVTLMKSSQALMAHRMIGFSGVSCALLGAYCAAHPNEKMLNFQLPIPIRYEVALVVLIALLYDIRGVLTKPNGTGHVVCTDIVLVGTTLTVLQAHISGYAVGAAYIYFDGKNNIWNPLTQFFSRALGRPNVPRQSSSTTTTADDE